MDASRHFDERRAAIAASWMVEFALHACMCAPYLRRPCGDVAIGLRACARCPPSSSSVPGRACSRSRQSPARTCVPSFQPISAGGVFPRAYLVFGMLGPGRDRGSRLVWSDSRRPPRSSHRAFRRTGCSILITRRSHGLIAAVELRRDGAAPSRSRPSPEGGRQAARGAASGGMRGPPRGLHRGPAHGPSPRDDPLARATRRREAPTRRAGLRETESGLGETPAAGSPVFQGIVRDRERSRPGGTCWGAVRKIRRLHRCRK